mmetsp:Transcript_27075/g.82009  ORF Transcript_27075/g.82009 Transcript_27075/m.82009 type:complete len:90 (-) Transcript_27075:1291-1560(-)
MPLAVQLHTLEIIQALGIDDMAAKSFNRARPAECHRSITWIWNRAMPKKLRWFIGTTTEDLRRDIQLAHRVSDAGIRVLTNGAVEVADK